MIIKKKRLSESRILDLKKVPLVTSVRHIHSCNWYRSPKLETLRDVEEIMGLFWVWWAGTSPRKPSVTKSVAVHVHVLCRRAWVDMEGGQGWPISENAIKTQPIRCQISFGLQTSEKFRILVIGCFRRCEEYICAVFDGLAMVLMPAQDPTMIHWSS